LCSAPQSPKGLDPHNTSQSGGCRKAGALVSVSSRFASVKFVLRLAMEFLASESCAAVLANSNFNVWFSVLMELSWVWCWV
jgi:hypothetical protein